MRRKQAAPYPLLSETNVGCSVHAACADGHRFLKAHPLGKLRRDAGWPEIVSRRDVRARSTRGTEFINPFV